MIRCLRDLREARMRGSDVRSGELFSYVDLEKRVPAKHPLRLVRVVVNEVLSRLDGDFSKAYAIGGRPSIAPERLLRALLLQAFYTIRSERQLMEQLDYNLLYRWLEAQQRHARLDHGSRGAALSQGTGQGSQA